MLQKPSSLIAAKFFFFQSVRRRYHKKRARKHERGADEDRCHLYHPARPHRLSGEASPIDSSADNQFTFLCAIVEAKKI